MYRKNTASHNILESELRISGTVLWCCVVWQ